MSDNKYNPLGKYQVRQFLSLEEIDGKAIANRVSNRPPQPTTHVVKDARGRWLVLWSDGSWRRKR